MRNNKFIGITAGAAAMASCAALYLVLHGGFGPGFKPEPFAATGWVMARQALNLLKPGGQVIVICRDTAAFKNPASDIQLASFNRTLNQAHVTATKTLALQVDPLRPVEVPPGDFFELIRKTPPGSVIVSFMGPPLLTEAQRLQLGEAKPGIVAFCSGNLPDRIDLKTLFDQQVIQAAVLSRKSPVRSVTPPRDPQAWFDEGFLAVTAATYATRVPATDAR